MTIYLPCQGDVVEVIDVRPPSLECLIGARGRILAILPFIHPLEDNFHLLRIKPYSTPLRNMELSAWLYVHLISSAAETCHCPGLDFPHRKGSQGCIHHHAS